ncbi:MAG TPA: diguanylate cyclase, partial [Epsilonproteobacteria bacterium]|nr:diguanylate cyclase [Campylobacterota bacterium]
MRLKTIFLSSLSLLMIALLVLTFAITFKNNQKFVEHQLYSASMDTAYAIGVAFATLEGADVLVDEKTIVNAIFDSGYYEYIHFVDHSGKLRIEARQPVVVKDVPEWFISLIPLKLQEASAGVTRQWKRIGTLYVKSHLGYAYAQLYKSFKALLVTYLIVLGLALPLLLLMINAILKSLKNIDKQAKAVLMQRFVTIDDTSKITEFKTVSRSMNAMVRKAESLFSSQAAIYNDYQRHLYRDEETGLYNKKYISMKLTELLEDKEEKFLHHQLLLIYVDDLVALKSTHGFQKYRDTMLHLTETIKQALDSKDLFARISDNEFIVLLENTAEEERTAKIAQLNTTLSLLPEKLKIKRHQLGVFAAMTPVLKALSTSELVSKADYTLQQARIQGQHAVYSSHETADSLNGLILKGKAEWKQALDAMLAQERLTHIGQNVYDLNDGSIYHHELFIRFRDDTGRLHSAEFFLPMAKAMQ